MKKTAKREIKRAVAGLLIVATLAIGPALLEGIANLICHGTWS